MTSDFGYQLLTQLDDGPSGTAWRARARVSGGRAMVRVFHGTRWGDEDDRDVFRERAEALGQLDHPHLARQLQAGCLDDGRPYLVSEYLDGEDFGISRVGLIAKLKRLGLGPARDAPGRLEGEPTS